MTWRRINVPEKRQIDHFMIVPRTLSSNGLAITIFLQKRWPQDWERQNREVERIIRARIRQGYFEWQFFVGRRLLWGSLLVFMQVMRSSGFEQFAKYEVELGSVWVRFSRLISKKEEEDSDWEAWGLDFWRGHCLACWLVVFMQLDGQEGQGIGAYSSIISTEMVGGSFIFFIHWASWQFMKGIIRLWRERRNKI